MSSYTFQMANEVEQVLKETKKHEGNAARPKGKLKTFLLMEGMTK